MKCSGENASIKLSHKVRVKLTGNGTYILAHGNILSHLDSLIWMKGLQLNLLMETTPSVFFEVLKRICLSLSVQCN